MIIRRHLLAGASAAITAAVLPMTALAHRQKYTLTQVIWNAETHTLDVTHSFHMHDAETALAAADIIKRPDLMSLKSKAQLALYTAERFTLQTLDGIELPLELLGAENEGRTVYVYQQLKLDQRPNGLIIDCRMLRELVDGQINNVDVNLSGEIRSLLFKGEDGPKRAFA